LIINSFIIGEEFKINEKEPIYLSFNENFTDLNLKYELKDITNDSFVALLFSFHENAYLEVTFSDENKNEIKRKSLNVSDSYNIFFTNEL